jgi:hypothetical protein
MNAANEVAVQAFLDGLISFPAITEVVSEVVTNHHSSAATTLEDVLGADRAGPRRGPRGVPDAPSSRERLETREQQAEGQDRGQGLDEEDPARYGRRSIDPGHDHAAEEELLHRETEDWI